MAHLEPAGSVYNKIKDGGRAMLTENASKYFTHQGSNMLPPVFKCTYTEPVDPMTGMWNT